MLLLALGLVILTGFFVAGEFVLVSLRKSDLECDQGAVTQRFMRRAVQRAGTNLSGAQLGITLCSLLIGYLLDMAFGGFLVGFEMSPAVRKTVSAAAAIVFGTVVTMLIGELLPKNLALARPMAVGRIVLPVQEIFTTLFLPLIRLVNAAADQMLRLFGIKSREEVSEVRSASEILILLRRSAKEGALPMGTAALIARTLRFNERAAGAVMTPWPQVVQAALETTAQQVLCLSAETGFTRFPVVNAAEYVEGIVTIEDVLRIPRSQRSHVSAAGCMRPVARVPETMKLDTLLLDLRVGTPFALVVDEYGDNIGVVTLEDLVEEMVGEIVDEHDPVSDEIVRLSQSRVIFSGLLRPDELYRRTGIRVPESDRYETVGGYMLTRLGKIPAAGDRVTLPGGTLSIERMDGLRIDRIRYFLEQEES